MNRNQELIMKLGKCAAACEYCSDACLNEDNIKMMVRCINLDRDCSDICGIAAGFAARGSENLKEILHLCADICTKCAVECEKHEHEHCKECAKACRECAEACKAA